MEKSIEKTWNDAFISEGSITVPKLNNLYNQKSKSVLQKLKNTYETDNKSLLPMAIILGIVLAYFYQIIIGAYVTTLIISLYFYNKKLLNKFKIISIESSNLTYLKDYHEVIKTIIKSTKKLLVFGMPLAISSLIILDYSCKEMSFLHRFFSGSPSIIEIGLIGLLIGVLASVIGLIAHYFSTRIVYLSLIVKLEDIINDLEELNN